MGDVFCLPKSSASGIFPVPLKPMQRVAWVHTLLRRYSGLPWAEGQVPSSLCLARQPSFPQSSQAQGYQGVSLFGTMWKPPRPLRVNEAGHEHTCGLGRVRVVVSL